MSSKICGACHRDLPIERFHVDVSAKTGRCVRCRECVKSKNKAVKPYVKCKRCDAITISKSGLCATHVRRAYLKRTGNAVYHKYEKTKNGFLMRVYRNMKSRVTGIQKEKAHIYLGLSILPKDVFYSWALNDTTFHELFACWVVSDYDRLKTPSIDRIDSTRGYDLDNIRWLTHQENSRLGAENRYAQSRSRAHL